MEEPTSAAGMRGEPPPGVSATGLVPGEDLVLARGARWRLLVPMRYVERIYGAALPAVVPSAGAPSHPLVSIGGTMVPLVLCDALLGADSITLAASDMMILLHHQGRRALLWVCAAEEVVPFEPLATDAALPALALALSGRDQAHAVLDVPRLLDLTFTPATEGAGMGVPT